MEHRYLVASSSDLEVLVLIMQPKLVKFKKGVDGR